MKAFLDMGMHHDHSHSHGKGGWKDNLELIFAILSGVFLILGFAIEKLSNLPNLSYIISYFLAIFFGGYFTTIYSIAALRKGILDIDFLMILAAIGACILGNYVEGALLLFLFSLGHALEHYAMDKATNSINSLTELAPQTALLKQGEDTIEVAIDDLEIYDIIVIRPNSKIAADGMVINGNSAVNQAAITGESIPVDKRPGDLNRIIPFHALAEKHKVYTGTINGNAVLEVKVLRLSKDSTLSRLVSLVQEAESKKSPVQEFADKFARIYVPSVLVLVTLLMFAFLVFDEPFSKSFYRAIAVLVAASPCALAISTPSAVLSGIARAAKGGVLIKGGQPLHAMGTINAIAFDKTGTLTTGNPTLTKVIPFGEHSEEDLLKIAVAVEDLSDHPLASAIAKDGKERLGEVELPIANDLKAIIARGVSATVNEKIAYIGNRRLMQEITNAEVPASIQEQMTQLEQAGHTAMIVYYHEDYLGIVAVQDTARPEAKESISKLKKLLGIEKIIMLTGDNQKVGNAIAKEVGIDEAIGDLLPEHKVEEIKKHAAVYRIAMVGDGVNDAPAMANSHLGISMGAASSDVALETSDAALLGDSIENLPFALSLARKSNQIVKQNLWISIGMIAILVPLAIAGLSMAWAVVFHEGSTLVVVLNALRLLVFRKDI